MNIEKSGYVLKRTYKKCRFIKNEVDDVARIEKAKVFLTKAEAIFYRDDLVHRYIVSSSEDYTPVLKQEET